MGRVRFPLILIASIAGCAALANARDRYSIIDISRESPLKIDLSAKAALDHDLSQKGYSISSKDLLWGSYDLNNDGHPETVIALVSSLFEGGGFGYQRRIYADIGGKSVPILIVHATVIETDCSMRHEGFL